MATTIREVWFPSISVSSTPVTVTDWAVDQLSAVNVRVEADNVASPVSGLDTEKTTSDGGWTSRTAVNVVVEPASVTAAPARATAKPARSSSVVVTDMTTSAAPSKSSSE